MNAPGVALTPSELAMIRQVLKENSDKASKVFVFGSRVSGKARPFSDVDLAIESPQGALSLSTLANLREAFNDSDLAFPVDIVDMNAISDEFKKKILGYGVLLSAL